MTAPRRYSVFAFLILVGLLVSACGPAAQTTIATAVAQTVQAQNTQSAQFTPTARPTLTRTPALLASLPPVNTKAPPTAPPAVGSIKPCYRASFVSDVSIPDGTIVSPGASFWKTWRVTNDGSCSWTSGYKFVFYDGDIMGGAYVYNFPTVAAPGQTVDIPIQLYAPTDTGTYTGKWMIEAPDKTIFGVGQYSVPLTVNVVVGSGTPVNAKTATVFDVTNVVYHIERRCTTANTFWHITADMTSNGPVAVTFNWAQSDGNGNRNKKVTFTEATTITVDDGEWSQRLTSADHAYYIQIITTSPSYHEFPWSEPFYLCNSKIGG
jgi:hypothetical protein